MRSSTQNYMSTTTVVRFRSLQNCMKFFLRPLNTLVDNIEIEYLHNVAPPFIVKLLFSRSIELIDYLQTRRNAPSSPVIME